FFYESESVGSTDTRRAALPAGGQGSGPWPVRKEIRERIISASQVPGVRRFQPWHVQAAITFTDTRGTRWRREVDGTLRRIKPWRLRRALTRSTPKESP